MDMTPAVPAGRQVIESYGDGRFRVSGAVHDGALLVLPERCVAWPVTVTGDITLESLAPLWQSGQGTVDLLLLGGGTRPWLIPTALRAGLKAQGIVVEAMDTGAACRTYNVLLAEERRVAAALLAID